MREGSPQGSLAGPRSERAPGRATRDPRGAGGRLGPGTKGPRGAPEARGGTPGERSRPGTHLRSGPAALLVEQEGGGQQQQPEAEPGPHGGAPGAAGTGGDPRGTAAGARGAAAGGSAAEGRGASAAHRPGRGGSRRRPERGPASSPICWRCPLPSAARGRRLKGEDPAARVRGGGSARPGDCGRRAPGRQGSALRTHPRQPRDPAPPAPVHRPEDRGLRPAPGGPRGRSRCPCAASGRPRSGGCARTAPDAGPEVRATPGTRRPQLGLGLGAPRAGWGLRALLLK